MARVIFYTIGLGSILAFFFQYWGWLGIFIGYLIPFVGAMIDNRWQEKNPESFNSWTRSRTQYGKHIKINVDGKTYSGHVNRDP